MALIKDKDAHLLLMANVAKEIQKHARDRQDYTLKGGTALLLCYNLNRFSTDLDFDSKNKLSEKKIVDAFHKASKESGVTLTDIYNKKDTDTVQRFTLHYKPKEQEDIQVLKIETSFRDYGQQEIREINGIKTYSITNLLDNKINAMENRSSARDLFDVNFITKNHPDQITEAQNTKIYNLAKDVDDIYYKYENDWKKDDVLSDKFSLTETALNLSSYSEEIKKNSLTRKETIMSDTNKETKYEQNKNSFTDLEATGIVTSIYQNENSQKLNLRCGQAKNEDGSYKQEQNISIVVPNSDRTKPLYDQLQNGEIKNNDLISISVTEAKDNITKKTAIYAKDTEANVIAKEGEDISQNVNMGVKFHKTAIINHMEVKQTNAGNEYGVALLSDDTNVAVNNKVLNDFKEGKINKGDAVTFEGNRNVKFSNHNGEIKKFINYNSNKATQTMTAEQIKSRAEEKKQSQNQESTAKKEKATTKKKGNAQSM